METCLDSSRVRLEAIQEEVKRRERGWMAKGIPWEGAAYRNARTASLQIALLCMSRYAPSGYCHSNLEACHSHPLYIRKNMLASQTSILENVVAASSLAANWLAQALSLFCFVITTADVSLFGELGQSSTLNTMHYLTPKLSIKLASKADVVQLSAWRL